MSNAGLVANYAFYLRNKKKDDVLADFFISRILDGRLSRHMINKFIMQFKSHCMTQVGTLDNYPYKGIIEAIMEKHPAMLSADYASPFTKGKINHLLNKIHDCLLGDKRINFQVLSVIVDHMLGISSSKKEEQKKEGGYVLKNICFFSDGKETLPISKQSFDGEYLDEKRIEKTVDEENFDLDKEIDNGW